MDKNNAEAVVNTSLETCVQKYEDYVIPAGTGLYCNWTWDQVLCWPPTRAGTVAKQRCPSYNGVDQTKFAYKRCSVDGRWEGKTLGEYSSPAGWTNYTPCYLPEVLKLMRKLYAGSEAAARVKMDIAERTRTLEIVGFSVSLTALLISLAIFCHFRSLRNNRTRIHKNLFIAMVIQVVIRLTLYIDQAVIRGASGNDVTPGGGTGQSNRSSFSVRTHRQGIDNTPMLCEASYVLLEYARTSMFMWMFIEGLYLHNMITVTVFQENSYYSMYTLVGWGGPIVMTTAWAVTTALRYGSSKCWWGYNLTHYFWILEGPRLGVIVLNFMFLLNIIRVLVVKLRQSHTSEIEQVRKAVRAALVLLPLLGITNLVNMAEAPLDRAVWEFALWSYTTHFLTSFQGFFIAFLYCFLNGEVRMAVMKSISIYLSLRQYQFTTRRNSIFSGVYITAELQQPPHLRGLPPVPPAPPPPRRPRQDDLDDDDDDDDLDEEEEDEEEDLEAARRRRRATSGRGRSSGSRSTTSRRRSLWTRLCCWWCARRGSSMVREAAMVSGMVSGAVGAVGGCSQPPQTQGCSSGAAAGGSPTTERPAPETRV